MPEFTPELTPGIKEDKWMPDTCNAFSKLVGRSQDERSGARELLDRLVIVFNGDVRRICEWLTTKHDSLNDRAPADLIERDCGMIFIALTADFPE